MSQKISMSVLTGGGTVRNLAGRDRGAAGRRLLGLDGVDHEPGSIIIEIPPEEIYSIADSYVQEMFGPSIVNLGGLENFFRKYLFVGHALTIENLNKSLRRTAAPRNSIFA